MATKKHWFVQSDIFSGNNYGSNPYIFAYNFLAYKNDGSVAVNFA